MRASAPPAASAVGRTLTTARLVLRPCTVDDVGDLHALWTDPDVRRYLWDDRTIARAEAAGVVDDSIASFARRGFGQWVVTVPDPGEGIGFAGLRPIEDGSDVELLYGLAPGHWGRGLATEAARAVLGHGFAASGLARIVGRVDTPNRRSIEVLERLGMAFEHERLLDGRPTVQYALARADFRTPSDTAPTRRR